MEPPIAIVISGLPASGKTTVGRQVALNLGIPYLDKDDFLERLFEQKGVGDSTWRKALSRESDALFRMDAQRHNKVVLISHWQPRGVEGTGTPTDWIGTAYETVVEVCCVCPPDIAARRFLARTRHAGHLDEQRAEAEVENWMRRLSVGYPLRLGELISVNTASGQAPELPIERLKRVISASG